MNRYIIFMHDDSVMATLVFTLLAPTKAKAISEVRAHYEREYNEKAPDPQNIEARIIPKSEGVVQLTNLHTTYKGVEVEREYNYTSKVEYV